MDILQGTPNVLILHALELASMRAGIGARIDQVTRGASVVKPGSLFPPLRRLEQRGWIEGECGPLENNRRTHYCKLTRGGSGQLVEEKRN
jgi:DNA-binding PadR family transcriptional regulator